MSDNPSNPTNQPHSSMDKVASPEDDNYLDIINQSFSSSHDLSLPDRVIASPTLSSSSAPSAKTQAQKGRIFNNLFNRDQRGGSNDTLGSSSVKASASSPIVSSHSPMPPHSASLSPNAQPRGIVDNNDSKNNKKVYPSVSSLHTSTTSGVGAEAASSSSLATSSLTASPSPKPKKSILKQSNSSTMVNNNPLPSIPKNTRPTTATQQKQQQQQGQQPVSDELSYLPVDGAAVVGAGIAEANRHASHTSAIYQPIAQYPQSVPYQQQQQQQSAPYQSYQPHPMSSLQQPTPAFYSYSSNNSNDYQNMNRVSSGTPPSSSSNTQFSGNEKSQSTDSTHQSSRNNSTPEPNYNAIQTDATLEGLAQRWFAYQAVMQKSYAEDPFYKRWTRSKWTLLFSTLLLLGYSGAIFGLSLSYIMGKPSDSPVVMEFHSNLIYLSFAGSIFGIASALVGFTGIFKENRIWLSYYTVILWPGFALYVAVGYIAFRIAKQDLRSTIKEDWIFSYSREQRLIVQHTLSCCGFQDPTYYAAYDMRCFPMTTLPGCRHKFSVFEKDFLNTLWTYSFSVALVHLFVMIAALLCSNHVNNLLRSARPGLVSFRDKKQQ